MPTIAVLVKNVPDTWSTKDLKDDYTLDRENVDAVIDEINEYAMEQALRIREAHPDAGYSVTAITIGPKGAEEALRKAIAMGADSALHVLDDALAGSDVLATAWTMTNAINSLEDVQLVIAGNASSDAGTGALPGIIAEYLQLPALTHLTSMQVDPAAASISGTRVSNEGSYELRAVLPALVTVTDQADRPRFPNFKGIMAAKKTEIPAISIADLGVAAEQVGQAHAATVVTNAARRPERQAGEVIRDNDSAATAKAIVDFLEERKLLS